MKRRIKTSMCLTASAGALRALLILAVGWLMVGIGSTTLHAAASTEYQVKAALILNFAEFIEWPASEFPDARAPILVGVLGDDPFGDALEMTFQGETAQGRSFVVKRSQQLDDLRNCHLLFVSKSEKDRQADILSSLNGRSIVTIGESDGFAQQGGVINFYIENNRVHFEINLDAAQHKSLRINSQLLKRGKIVESNSTAGRN
jgi:YfiR/HmsC-like